MIYIVHGDKQWAAVGVGIFVCVIIIVFLLFASFYYAKLADSKRKENHE